MTGARTRRSAALATGAVALAAALTAPPAAEARPPLEDRVQSRGVPLPAFEQRRTATIQTDNGLAVAARMRPGPRSRKVLELHGGSQVRIVCQRRGKRVRGKFGTSRLWDLIDIGGGRGAYVTDTYVFTGSDGRVARTCPRRSGRPPQTPEEQESVPRGAAARVVRWARRHSGWWRFKYSMTYRLPTDRGVRYMRRHQPPRGGIQGCDCSSFVRWAMAQGGVDVGTYTGNMWTANDRMPFTTSNAVTPNGLVLRGYGGTPPGGWRKGDLVFWGVTGLDKDVGHVALYAGRGRIIQCSSSLGSNAGKSLTYNGQPTGWIRYRKVVGR
jgi:cell wall-associated NlpC family hydrolase